MFRIMCTACGAKTVEQSFLTARTQAELHATVTNHWGKVIFWKISTPRHGAGVVRVIHQWGACRFLGHVKTGQQKIA